VEKNSYLIKIGQE